MINLNIRSTFVEKVKALIKLLPFGKDIWLILTRNRGGISYAGLYESFDQAENSVKATTTKYDVINSNKSRKQQQEDEVLDHWCPDTDYPLLFWTAQNLKTVGSVLELGGSLGHLYYGIKRMVGMPENVNWTIAELPEAVKLGKELSRKRNETQLAFLESDKLESALGFELFITAGTIQYMEQPIWETLKKLKHLPSRIIIHNLPTHTTTQAFTIQNLGVCQVPYRIYSKDELLEQMQKLGFSLEKTWTNEREITIPFHRNYKIEGYLGYMFKAHSAETIGS